MSFEKKYLELSHRYFFESLAIDDIRAEIQGPLSQRNLQGKWVYVAHTHPLKFILSFLALVDRGAFPICLSSAQALSFDSWAFVEGVWTGEKNARTDESPSPKYAVPTSGTTGKPKLCQFDFKQALGNAEAHALGFGMESRHEILQTLPVSHSYGIIAYILTPLTVGCSVNFCPGMVGIRTLRKDPNPRDSILHSSPSQARFILRDRVSVPQLQKLTVGGGALALDELEALQNLFPHTEIYVSYGLTEAGPRVTAGKYSSVFKNQFSTLGSVSWLGSALPGVRVKLREGPSEGIGQLCVQSPFLKLNLLPEETQEDWLVTRDRVMLKDGQVFFLSREEDLLKYGGITIYPKDIEDAARAWPGVTDAIVLKESDPMYGDKPLLVIEGEISLELIHELLVRDISSFSAFKDIHVQSRFPRKSLEKIDREKLKEQIRSSGT